MNPLKRLRLDAGISRTNLAKETGVSYLTIRSIEEDESHNPHVDTLTKFAEFFGVKQSQLLENGDTDA